MATAKLMATRAAPASDVPSLWARDARAEYHPALSHAVEEKAAEGDGTAWRSKREIY